jgi:hypothetical protein
MPRVLSAFMRSTSICSGTGDRATPRPSLSKPAAEKAGCIATAAVCRGRLILEPREHAGAGAGNAGAHRAGIERRLFHRGEACDQRRATWFHQHIAQAGAHQRGVAALAASQHQAPDCALCATNSLSS